VHRGDVMRYIEVRKDLDEAQSDDARSASQPEDVTTGVTR
jgi:hypothetical protein